LVQSSSLILVIWFFTNSYGVVGAALAWLPAITLVQILCVYFIWNIFHDPLKDARKPLFAIFIATIAGAVVAYAVISVLPNIVGLIVAGLLAALITGAILWISDHRFSLGLLRNITIAFPQVSAILKSRKT
jgi:hypothetical protein